MVMDKEEENGLLWLVSLLDLWRRERGGEREAWREFRVGLIREDGGLEVLFIEWRVADFSWIGAQENLRYHKEKWEYE